MSTACKLLNFSHRSRIWLCMLCVLLALPAGGSYAAKDTPFGVEWIPPNYPNATIQDAINTMALTASIGGHSSFVWHWGDQQALNGLAGLVPLMRQFGLKSFLQIGAIFLGDPGPPPPYVKSFANAETRALYLKEVKTMAQLKPDYLVLCTEVNLMHRFNNPEFQNYRTLYKEAYDLIKSISPSTKVGASYLYNVWFATYFNDKVDVAAQLTPYDFVAFTSYPEWLIREGHYRSIADISPDFHGFARMVYPNTPIVFSEVGWSSKVLGTPELQAEFVRNLPRLFSGANPELVTWAVMHDMEFFTRNLLTAEQVKFLEGLDVNIDEMFGHFNGMGLRDGRGTPKPAYLEAEKLPGAAFKSAPK